MRKSPLLLANKMVGKLFWRNKRQLASSKLLNEAIVIPAVILIVLVAITLHVVAARIVTPFFVQQTWK